MNTKIIAIGEIIIDMIGVKTEDSILQTQSFKPVIGGSPLNFIHYMALFGTDCQLIGTVGNDDFGKKAIQSMHPKIDASTVRMDPLRSTSLIVLNKSQSAPNFISYRSADFEILDSQTSSIELKSTQLVHSTAFALSRTPARDTVMALYQKMAATENLISIDFNYSSKIWNGNEQLAQEYLNQLANWGAFIKVSEDDVQRLFGVKIEPHKLINSLLEKGARLVCFTCGSKGAYAANTPNEIYFEPAHTIEVVDSTGAGDSFWAGFLHSYLTHHSIPMALAFGNEIASKKLQMIGPLQKIE